MNTIVFKLHYLYSLLLIALISFTLFTVYQRQLNEFISSDDNKLSQSAGISSYLKTFHHRRKHLNSMCSKYKSDSFRSEWYSLNEIPSSFGNEVVYLKNPSSGKLCSVCIPHKVGSHSWGRFVESHREISITPEQFALNGIDFISKSKEMLTAIVVRHPMERLISVYRMIFQDWCNQDRFLAKQWTNVCQQDVLLKSSNENIPDNNNNIFTRLWNEQKFGNDRFMKKIWKHFHPNEELNDPKSQLRFTFPQFVRFIVNGTSEIGSDINDQTSLSSHWAPYWKECSLCSEYTKPYYILHMDTLEKDLKELFNSMNLPSEKLVNEFPHTHTQNGGHSSELFEKYFSTLSKSEVYQLYDKYKIDHDLFGFNIQPYLDVATM